MITKSIHTAWRLIGGAVAAALLVSGCSCGSRTDADGDTDLQTVEPKHYDTLDGPPPEIQYQEWNPDSYTDDEVYDEGYDEGYRQGLQDGEDDERYGDGFYDDNEFGARYELFCAGYEDGYEAGYAEGNDNYEEEEERKKQEISIISRSEPIEF